MVASKPKQPSYERLVRARATVARLVEMYGDWLMPHFERLDDACVDFENRQSRLALAKQAAGLSRQPLSSSLQAVNEIVSERQHNLR